MGPDWWLLTEGSRPRPDPFSLDRRPWSRPRSTRPAALRPWETTVPWIAAHALSRPPSRSQPSPAHGSPRIRPRPVSSTTSCLQASIADEPTGTVRDRRPRPSHEVGW